MPKDIIVIGASSGGIEALRVLAQAAEEEGAFQVRCHTGYAYSIESLLTDITEKMDDALWNSIRAFEEGELFMRHMAQHLDHGENSQSAESILKRADETKRRANLMRQAAVNGRGLQAARSSTDVQRSGS